MPVSVCVVISVERPICSSVSSTIQGLHPSRLMLRSTISWRQKEALASYQRHTFFNYSLAVCACEIESHIKVEMGKKETRVLALFFSLLPSTSGWKEWEICIIIKSFFLFSIIWRLHCHTGNVEYIQNAIFPPSWMESMAQTLGNSHFVCVLIWNSPSLNNSGILKVFFWKIK